MCIKEIIDEIRDEYLEPAIAESRFHNGESDYWKGYILACQRCLSVIKERADVQTEHKQAEDSVPE